MYPASRYILITLATCCFLRVCIQNVPNVKALYLILLLNGYDMDHQLPHPENFVEEDKQMVNELNKLFDSAKKLRDSLATYSQ